MWVRQVEFPDELIAAHRAGSLVIFVGAGASRDAPSDLPDFRTLAVTIAAEAQVSPTKADLARLDDLLGRLADGQFDVHGRVAAHLNRPSSRPNRLHRAIAALSAATRPVRIVTTNYDLHLSTALRDRGTAFDEYAGPALPIGDDFTGLVYLHGNLTQSPSRLVVTDRDFGSAYLTTAWAARFLERMFAHFSVLFVGYSHDDMVMRYLARGLGPGSQRYILTPEPEAAEWRSLGIHPLGYEVVGDSHDTLVDAVGGWAELASMGLLDHRQRVAELVGSPPSQVPEEDSYLEAVIADPGRVRFFVESARGEHWLTWAANQPEFTRLFDRSAPPSECSSMLASWFAEHYVADEQLSATALRVVQQMGGRLSVTMWGAIGHRLHVVNAPRPTWLTAWLVLLVRDAPDDANLPWLDFALHACRWPADASTALMLLERLTEPYAVLGPSVSGESTQFDIVCRGSEHWVREAWTTFFAPHIGSMAPSLLATADAHLRRAHRQLVALGGAENGWDPLSYRRSAIEPNDQDQLHATFDVVIDAARDSLQTLIDAGDERGPGYLATWAESGVPLLQRLAVHGWTYRTDVSCDQKLVWLKRQGWLYNVALRHEVFRLVATALPGASPRAADALVADAARGPEDLADVDLHAYARFNALSWIHRHALELGSATSALESLRNEHPTFEEQEHPDLTRWWVSGPVMRRPPMSEEELHRRIAGDPPGAVAELRVYESIPFSLDGSTWSDALRLLTSTVTRHPTDGLAVLDAPGGDQPALASAVINGWSAAQVEPDVAVSILQRLAEVDLASVADSLSRLLFEGGGSAACPTAWHQLPASRQLATALWDSLEPTDVTPDTNRWLDHAINHPAGRIALFWAHTVESAWTDAGDRWEGIPNDVHEALERLLVRDDLSAALARAVLASQAYFFFRADRAWYEAHIFPLLDWTKTTWALPAWDGFLMWGRWDDQMLEGGLLDRYVEAARHRDELSTEARRRLWEHMAAIALHSDLDPQSWIRTLTTTVDLADRVAWMSLVGRQLARLPEAAIENQWHRWMSPYWKERLDSVPAKMTLEEASALSVWVVYLTHSIAEGVDLATRHDAGLGDHAELLQELARDGRVDRAPRLYARLVAHLLRGTQAPFWGGNYLEATIGQLNASADPADIHSIAEEATRLGLDTRNW